MIRRAQDSPLRFTWVTADAAYGQDGRLRRFIEDPSSHYVVAVPKRFRREAPPVAWQRLSAGPGAKGERVYDWAGAESLIIWASITLMTRRLTRRTAHAAERRDVAHGYVMPEAAGSTWSQKCA